MQTREMTDQEFQHHALSILRRELKSQESVGLLGSVRAYTVAESRRIPEKFYKET